MKFKSKIDFPQLLGYIVMIGIAGFILYATVFFNETASNLYIILGMVIGMVVMMYAFGSLFNTYYQFQETQLYVHSGLFKKFVPYKDVMHVKETHKYFTYNCLSLDKLVIEYRDGNNLLKVHVSPKDKEEFLKLIRFNCKSAKIERK